MNALARPGVVVLAVLLALGPAVAQSSLGIGNAEIAMPTTGSFAWIAVIQRDFFASLRAALVAIRADGGGGLWLVALSFAYGVFHAAGPGHGKAVISSYMLANEVMLRRGVVLSFASALLQALSAIVLVGAGWFVLRGTSVSMTDVGRTLELASYAMIAAIGGWLLCSKLLRMARRRRLARPTLASGGLAFSAPGNFSSGAGASAGSFRAEDCVGSSSDDDCGCGRSHVVAPAALAGPLGLGGAANAVLAVGLRPCAGAIVVLTFCLMNELYVSGLLSVVAMALGTGLTVAALASLAVFAKGFALRLGGGGTRLRDALEIGGALLLVLFGLGLLNGALSI